MKYTVLTEVEVEIDPFSLEQIDESDLEVFICKASILPPGYEEWSGKLFLVKVCDYTDEPYPQHTGDHFEWLARSVWMYIRPEHREVAGNGILYSARYQGAKVVGL